MANNVNFVFSGNFVEYQTRAGKDIQQVNIYYFNLADNYQSLSERGFLPVVSDVINNFNLDDFQFPGFYEFRSRPVPGRGRPEPKISQVKLLSPFELKPNGDHYLLFGARRVELVLENGKQFKGVRFFGCDPTAFYEDSDLRGFPLIEFTKEKAVLSDYNFPAYYDLEFHTIRGSRGSALLVVDSIKKVGDFKFPNLAPAPTPA